MLPFSSLVNSVHSFSSSPKNPPPFSHSPKPTSSSDVHIFQQTSRHPQKPAFRRFPQCIPPRVIAHNHTHTHTRRQRKRNSALSPTLASGLRHLARLAVHWGGMLWRVRFTSSTNIPLSVNIPPLAPYFSNINRLTTSKTPTDSLIS